MYNWLQTCTHPYWGVSCMGSLSLLPVRCTPLPFIHNSLLPLYFSPLYHQHLLQFLCIFSPRFLIIDQCITRWGKTAQSTHYIQIYPRIYRTTLGSDYRGYTGQLWDHFFWICSPVIYRFSLDGEQIITFRPPTNNVHPTLC